MSESPYGTTIFCDDIRQEVTGKTTLVGCYSDEMVISGTDFPVLLSQFAFVATYFEPISLPWKPLKICLFMPGQKGSVFEAGIDNPPPRLGELRDGKAPTLRSFRVAPILSPFRLKEPGRIKVRAYRGDEKIRMGSLLVRKEDAERSETPQQT